MSKETTPPSAARSLRGALWTAALAALAGFAAVYAWLALSSSGSFRLPSGEPAGRSEGARGSFRLPSGEPAGRSEGKSATLPGPGGNPLSTGQMAGFVFKKAPEPVAEIAFVGGDGKPRTLADWKGRVVLLNLWATWCGPCRKEMPALDRLQQDLGSDKFEVVALAIDRAGIEKARQFLAETKVDKLALYVDPTAKLTAPLKVIGLPTTILIKDGQEIGRLVGPAEWDSPEAKRLIRAVMP